MTAVDRGSSITINDQPEPQSSNLSSLVNNIEKGLVKIPQFQRDFVWRKHKTTGKGSELWKKLFHYYSFNRAEFLTHYHQRSNVETTFSMIKAKFGERLRCKTETAQINEALCKVLCHNLCVVIQSMYELGVEPQFRVEAA